MSGTAPPSFVTQVQKDNGKGGGNGSKSEPPPKPAAKVSEESSEEESVGGKGFFSCCGCGGKKKKKGTKKKKTTDTTTTTTTTTSPLPLGNLPRDENGFNSPRGGDLTKTQKKPAADAQALLPQQTPAMAGRKCLVLDLDETLVHSSFQPVDHYDFMLPVHIDDVTYTVYVAKRPGVDEFMKAMGKVYEVVIFTASLSQYADPVLDLLDIHKVVSYRLFREHCTLVKGSYVKDMGRMGRPIQSVMIMDNSPHSYAFNPENAIPCESWFDDQTDHELLDFIPVLLEVATCDNVINELEKRNLNGYDALMALNANNTTSGGDTDDLYTSEYTTDTTSWTDTGSTGSTGSETGTDETTGEETTETMQTTSETMGSGTTQTETETGTSGSGSTGSGSSGSGSGS